MAAQNNGQALLFARQGQQLYLNRIDVAMRSIIACGAGSDKLINAAKRTIDAPL